MAKRKVYGVAVVGLGAVSSGHIASWLHEPRRAKIVGLYDPVARFCRERKQQYVLDDAVIYDSYEQVLDDGRVDIVNLCSMSDVHDEQICRALDAGKHILTEKPTGYDLEGRRKLRWYSRKYKNRKVGVAYSLRYYPINMKVREWVRAGVIGEPMWAHIEHHHPGHGSPPAAHKARRGIDRATDKGGRYIAGSDMVHATHPHDLARYMLGDPCEVYAVRNACGVFATITFENEAIGQVHAGSTAAKGLSHVTPVMIQGTEGTIFTENITRQRGQPPKQTGFYMNSTRKGARLKEIKVPQVGAHADDVRAKNFLDALTKGTDLICDLEDSIRTSELLHALWNSISLGIRVPLQRSSRTG